MLTFGDDEVKTAVEAATGLAPLSALEAFADLDQDVRQVVARIRRTRWCRTTTPSAASSARLPMGALREVTYAKAGSSAVVSDPEPRKDLEARSAPGDPQQGGDP
jgi:carbonic anhydrase